MRKDRFAILWLLTPLFILFGCSESEVLTTFEEVREMTEQVPITFSTYLNTTKEESATTRADYQYFTYYHSKSQTWIYKDIPFLGETRGNDKNGENWVKVGHSAYNNYIVGLYAFYHQGSDWNTEKDNPKLQADFMFNQPLLHLWDEYAEAGTPPYWHYEPLKYWPNNKKESDAQTGEGYNPDNQSDKVTFISYYPFQDFVEKGKEADLDNLVTTGFYRDGSGSSTTSRIDWINHAPRNVSNPLSSKSNASYGGDYRTFDPATITLQNKNLTYIEPPKAVDDSGQKITGEGAYTFGFEQTADVREHIDFMIGVNKDETKRNLTEDGVRLKLRHTLTAVFFITSFDPTRDTNNKYLKDNVPTHVEWKINYIKLTNLKYKGTVAPVVDESGNNISFPWKLENDRTTYTIFNDGTVYPYYISDISYTSSTDTYSYASKSSLSGWDVYNNNNGAGYKWIILALPQELKTNSKYDNENTYVDVNYDLTYTCKDGKKVIYNNCYEHLIIKNPSRFTEAWGKSLAIQLVFRLNGVNMDAEIMEWDEGENPSEVPHIIDTQEDKEEDNTGSEPTTP